jgi:hypothetical protein
VDDFNPYAAPEARVSPGPLAAEADEGRGVWRDGKLLVMAKVARLPSRCVKCNEPATDRLKRSLSWHHPYWYFLIFLPFGPLICIIVVLSIRKTAKIEVPLCEQHRASRIKGILFAWICALSGIALGFAAGFIEEDYGAVVFVVGVALFFFGLIFGSLTAQVVPPQKIDERHVWLKKVSPRYLAMLPPLPYTSEEEHEKAKAYIDEL